MSAVAATIGKRVLLVEDHTDCASSIEALLKHWGHEVKVARNCAQATDLCRGGAEFDVLFLDILLPDGSGLELAAQFRQTYPDARLVAVTALGMPNEIAAIKGAGFHAHVLKPFRPDKLLTHLN